VIHYDVISIGFIRQNRFLDAGNADAPAQRPSHATTTLIRDEGATILVDPSLPGQILAPLLGERVGLSPGDVDAVFLTTLRPTHRRGLTLFENADWLVSPIERQFVLEQLAEQNEAHPDDDAIAAELAIVGRCKDADDKLSPGVSLFPAPGASVGSAALLVTPPAVTVAVAGDAIVHGEHFVNGAIWQGAADAEQARESMVELIEIADLIVPGHDNILLNPRGRFF
jgi:glyoxylase-like metal-dependent hydrolase (beta-lactamase superfamily II)